MPAPLTDRLAALRAKLASATPDQLIDATVEELTALVGPTPLGPLAATLIRHALAPRRRIVTTAGGIRAATTAAPAPAPPPDDET